MERTVLIFAALYVFAPSVFGQNPTSPVTITAPRPGKVAIYYNAVKDTTTVVLGFSDVGGESPWWVVYFC